MKSAGTSLFSRSFDLPHPCHRCGGEWFLKIGEAGYPKKIELTSPVGEDQ